MIGAQMNYAANFLGGARYDIVKVSVMMRQMLLAQCSGIHHFVANKGDPHHFLQNSHQNLVSLVSVGMTITFDSSYRRNHSQGRWRLFFCRENENETFNHEVLNSNC